MRKQEHFFVTHKFQLINEKGTIKLFQINSASGWIGTNSRKNRKLM